MTSQTATVRVNTLDDAKERRLIMERFVRGTTETVFEALTEPARLHGWWRPPGFSEPQYRIELRTGGEIEFSMKGPDGATHVMAGEVKHVARPVLLTMVTSALTPEGEVALVTETTYELWPAGDATRVIVDHRVLTVNETGLGYLAGMPGAWGEKLDRLADYVEGRPVV